MTWPYSMDSIRAIFNVYFSDDSTVLLDKKLNMTIISKCSYTAKCQSQHFMVTESNQSLAEDIAPVSDSTVGIV